MSRKASSTQIEVGRSMGVNQVTGMVPDQLGISLKKALETSDELREAYENDGEIRDFDARIKRFLNLDPNETIQYICEPKFDGLAVEVIYESERYFITRARFQS